MLEMNASWGHSILSLEFMKDCNCLLCSSKWSWDEKIMLLVCHCPPENICWQFSQYACFLKFCVSTFLLINMKSSEFCYQVVQFLDSQGFFEFLERSHGSEECGRNLLEKLQDAIARGQDPYSVLPDTANELQIITIADPSGGTAGRCIVCNFWIKYPGK